MMSELKTALDQTLIDSLPKGLKDVIDRFLARGASKVGILSVVRVMIAKAAGGDPNKGKLVEAAVEAYLETK